MSQPPFDVQDLVKAYAQHDRSQNHGKGRSDSADSGERARAYLDVISTDVADKHERDWVDTSQSSGAPSVLQAWSRLEEGRARRSRKR